MAEGGLGERHLAEAVARRGGARGSASPFWPRARACAASGAQHGTAGRAARARGAVARPGARPGLGRRRHPRPERPSPGGGRGRVGAAQPARSNPGARLPTAPPTAQALAGGARIAGWQGRGLAVRGRGLPMDHAGLRGAGRGLVSGRGLGGAGRGLVGGGAPKSPGSSHAGLAVWRRVVVRMGSDHMTARASRDWTRFPRVPSRIPHTTDSRLPRGTRILMTGWVPGRSPNPWDPRSGRRTGQE